MKNSLIDAYNLLIQKHKLTAVANKVQDPVVKLLMFRHKYTPTRATKDAMDESTLKYIINCWNNNV